MGESAWKRKWWRRSSRRYESWTREIVPGLWIRVGRDFLGVLYYRIGESGQSPAASLDEAADRAEAEAIKLLERGLAKLRRANTGDGARRAAAADLRADGALLGAIERDGGLGFSRILWPLDRPTENCLRRYLNARELLRRSRKAER
jgi:hypothetical protein